MKKGLTLIEVLVSLGIASIVFLMVSSLLVTFYTSDTRSKQLELFERTKNDAALLLSNSVRWADEVTTDGSSITADENNFYLQNGRLYKNGEAFSSAALVVTRFEVQDYSNLLGYPSLQILIGLQDAQNLLRTDEMKLVVSARKTTVQTGQ